MPVRPQPGRAVVGIVLAFLAYGCSSTVEPHVAVPTAPTVTSTESSVALCGGRFSPPPFGELTPVPGVSIRAIDTAHLEVRNTTSQQFFFAAFQWEWQDNLVCGRGIVASEVTNGSVAAGATVVADAGSEPDRPTTLSLWEHECGEACSRPPIA